MKVTVFSSYFINMKIELFIVINRNNYQKNAEETKMQIMRIIVQFE